MNVWDEHGCLVRESIGMRHNDCAEGWCFNLYRMVHAYGRGGDAVYKVWATRMCTHTIPPPDDGTRYWSGSRETPPVYRTKELAWAALSAEFERWVDAKRGDICRMGEPPQTPRTEKKAKKRARNEVKK